MTDAKKTIELETQILIILMDLELFLAFNHMSLWFIIQIFGHSKYHLTIGMMSEICRMFDSEGK